jgi:hypothetical protein
VEIERIGGVDCRSEAGERWLENGNCLARDGIDGVRWKKSRLRKATERQCKGSEAEGRGRWSRKAGGWARETGCENQIACEEAPF